ncbi:MAG: alginate O-acetyltransferase complex protein AlgJ, partial [Planctomycetota bacterium]
MSSSDRKPEPALERAQSAIERLRDGLLILGFALGLAFPLVAQLAGWGAADSSSEKRVLTEFPALAPDDELRASVAAAHGSDWDAWSESLQRWPKLYETWFDDHFAYRTELIRLHHRGYVLGLGVSPRADIVIGKQGWLFTNASDQEQAALDQVRGLFPFNQAQLLEWQRFLEECRDWFADRGVSYYLTIAPSKPTIHPEFLPPGLSSKDPVTRLDQLLEWLAATEARDGYPGVPMVDLRPDLLAAKESLGGLYRRTDTHWNAAGAMIASAALVERLREAVPGLLPIDSADFTFERVPAGGGDLAAILNLADLLSDEIVRSTARTPIEFTRELEGMVPVRIPDTALGAEENLAEERQRPFRLVQNRTDLPRLLMFRDSYGSQLVPFLARAFSTSSFYWQYRIHDPAIMALERPDVVVQEIGERVLMRNVGLPRNEQFMVQDLGHMRTYRASEFHVDSATAEAPGSTTLTLSLADLP